MNLETSFPFLVELLVKSVAIMLLAVIVGRMWRSATAAQRRLVWCAALGCLLVLPFTRLVAPRWPVPIEPAVKTTVSLPAGQMKAVMAESPVPALRSVPRKAAWKLPDWRSTLIVVWLTGVAGLLIHRLIGSWRLSRLEAKGRVADMRVLGVASEVFRELDIQQAVRVKISAECQVPMTWGAFRAVVMLPEDAPSWDDAQLRTALRHEAGHIASRDYFIRWVAQVMCAFYWPNPLVWFVARSLRTAQEQATDDLVIRTGTPAADYAAQLCDAARRVVDRGIFARSAVAMASPSTLETRVRAIVEEARDRRPLSRRAALVGSALMALTLIICAAAQLQGADGEKPPSTPSDSVRTSKRPQQIEIETKFVEMTPSMPKDANLWTIPGNKVENVFSDPQFQVIIRAINQRKGADLLSAPRITTRTKTRAVVEVVREFRYPTDWIKEEGKWKPKNFESKNAGVTMEILPEIREDGTIDLQLRPSVVEFLGFVDIDTGKRAAAAPDWKKQGGLGVMPDFASLEPISRLTPIFSERTAETTVNLQDGYTVAISQFKETARLEPFDKERPNRQLIVFVSARIIDPSGRAEVEGVALDRAQKIIIPKVEFRDTPLDEALDFLRKAALDAAEDKQGVNLILKPGSEPDPKITLSLISVPLSEALHYVAELANRQLVAEGNAFILIPKATPAAPKGGQQTPR